MSQTLPHAIRNAALITGASTGIGRELARLLAQDGYPVVLVARDRAALETLAGELGSRDSVATHVIVQDLAVPHAAREIVETLTRAQLGVEVLVNNAGFGIQGKFADGDESAELSLLQVNVVALTQLTRLLLPAMLQRGTGRILNVASTAAFQPGPYMALYYASKAFVLSLSQALHYELRNTAVSVTALCPARPARSLLVGHRWVNPVCFRVRP